MPGLVKTYFTITVLLVLGARLVILLRTYVFPLFEKLPPVGVQTVPGLSKQIDILRDLVLVFLKV